MDDPILQTDRLVFRPFTPDDFDLLADLHSDPLIQRFMGGSLSRDAVQTTLEGFIAEQELRGHSTWKVSLGDGTFIGRAGVGFWPPTGDMELGYGLKPAFRGQGFATEAAAAVAGWMFANTPASHLIGFTRPDNLASQHVLLKIGMTYEGIRDIGASAPAALFRINRPA